MPNWCNNQLTVIEAGHRLESFVQLEEFRSRSSSDNDLLIFSNLVPEPGRPNDDHYDPESWRGENWGTEREPKCDQIEEEPGTLRYQFVTAWSPPEAWVLKVSGIFPALLFDLEYDEPGIGYAGIRSFRGGIVIEETEIDIKEIYPHLEDE